MRRIFFLASVLMVAVSCSTKKQLQHVKLVNPMMGTAVEGNIIPLAVAPFGMVQLGPDTRNSQSGYRYQDRVILGFSHIHKNGAGCGDMLDLLFQPFTGAMDYYNHKKPHQFRGYESFFSHDNEHVTLGKYTVKLDDNNVKVDLTATKRCGFHQYHFPKTDSANVVIDLVHSNAGGCSIYPDENHDTVVNASIKIVDKYTVEGFRVSTGFIKEQHVYFVAKFSEPFEESLLLEKEIPVAKTFLNSRNIRSVFRFKSDGIKPVLVKVGISPVSIEGAIKNLNNEIPHWNFDRTVQETQQAWADELNKFSVETKNAEQKVIFYTSLYNVLMYPSLYSDVDGKYRGPDFKVHQAKGYDYMGQISGLWDTFRAQNPLMTLINPKIGNYHVKTFLDHYKIFGQLPLMLLSGNETFTMLGYHSMPVIADTYYKGLRDYDSAAIFEAMKVSANVDTFGYWLKVPLGTLNYKKYGYIPYDKEFRSVSTTLEYSYDDWCIAQMAKQLGKQKDYEFYMARSRSYRQLFDPKTGFMRAKSISGKWLEPFEPLLPEHQKGSYVEGNAWQWTFFAPHDPEGLIELYGGNDNFIKKLDELFTTVDSDTKRALSVPDMSGLIGQYAHGNEPSHHIPYFYNYANGAWKTQQRVNEILTTLYKNTPDGLPGNDDTGQLSAWYVFGSMGFYPVRHGNGEYAIGAPLLDKIEFTHTISGKLKKLKIIAENKTKANIYVQSLTLNGKPYEKSIINHKDIFSDNATLIFVMGPAPNKSWGKNY